jgi:biopolymer transport protein ExbD
VSRQGRFKKSEEGSIEDAELNLVPYLDIMVNLIMFMLVTYQVLAELKVIPFNPPASGPDTNIGENKPDEPAAMLTVLITAAGFRILTTQADMGVETVPLAAGDKLDYAELSKRLSRIQKDNNIDPQLIVVAEPQIIYDVVVKTLDAIRTGPAGEELFPMVTLGMAVGN